MIDPPPRAFISGWHSRMRRSVASVPDSHVINMSSSVVSSSGTAVAQLLRVVHQDVDAAERVNGRGNARRAIGRNAHVALHGDRARARGLDLPDRVRAGHRIELEHRDVGTRLGQRQRDAATHATTGAGDDRDLAPQRHADGLAEPRGRRLWLSRATPAGRLPCR